MDTLVIMVEANEDGRSFDLIMAKLIDAARNHPITEQSMLFELDILARYRTLQGDQTTARIEGLVKTYITRLGLSVDTQLKQRRSK